MCPVCHIIMATLEQANTNTKIAIALYDDVVVQRDHYKQMLEELITSVKTHIAICHPEPNPQFDKWMN